ncbi:MAG: hypothetical protein LBL09_03515 [Oscillospiraceae bacterium]|jgi:hypothetical protein|nr:hypothetical protein [Oscillospiraceae bacterium]
MAITQIKKLCKLTAILLAAALVLLIIVNIAYAIYDKIGYSGPPDRDGGMMNNALYESLEFLKENHGLDLSVPCVDGSVQIVLDRSLKVSRWPSDMSAKDTSVVLFYDFQKYVGRHFAIMQDAARVEAGTVLAAEAGMFSNAPFFESGWRKVFIGDNLGGQMYIRLDDLSRLYYQYLTDNSLAAQFEQETGHKLTRSNATAALLHVDEQLFERNIANSPDYKYSPLYLFIDMVLFYTVAALALCCIALLIVFRQLRQKERRNEFLARTGRDE